MSTIKIHEKVRGIPQAQSVVSNGKDGEAVTVTLFISALDALGIPTMVASLRMPPSEARELAERLVAHAEFAERA